MMPYGVEGHISKLKQYAEENYSDSVVKQRFSKHKNVE